MGPQQHLSIVICQDAGDAIAQGYDYASKGDEYKPIEISKAVVVRNGTEAGKPTVDFVLVVGELEDTHYVIVFQLITPLRKMELVKS